MQAATRRFKETVVARAQHDREFHQAMLTEAINARLSGDPATSKGIMRDLVNATAGFERLARATKKPTS
jgi:hypothetical protein